MPFFLNPFDSEYRGNFPGVAFPDFKVPANRNRSDLMVAHNFEPYDLSADSDLTINFAFDADFKNYGSVTVDVSADAASSSAVTAAEVVAALNADSDFAELFVASVQGPRGGGSPGTVVIRSNKAKTSMRVFISNVDAETKLNFNKYAGVAELPSYCERDTIDNRRTYDDSQAMLILLDESDSIDRAIITAAGFDYTAMQDDYELLGGRSENYMFTKLTVDGSSRITEKIEYRAGAVAGDLAKKTIMTYTAAKTQPDKIVEIPYVLSGSDLVTP